MKGAEKDTGESTAELIIGTDSKDFSKDTAQINISINPSKNTSPIIGIEDKGILEKLFYSQLESLRNNLFTLFGILVSVVTFLFSEIQILNNSCSKEMMIGLSLIILGAICFFVVLIKFLLCQNRNLKSEDDKKGLIIPIVFFVISLVFIVIGINISSNGDELKCRTDTIIQQYEESLLDDLKRNFRFY